MTTRRRNPSGFVRKHPDTATTRWQGIIKYPDPDAPGQWKQRSATFARRVDAQKWVDATIIEHRRTPQYRPPSDITVQDYFVQWLDEVAATRVQDTTLVAYRRYIKPLLKEFGKKPLALLSPADLQGLYKPPVGVGESHKHRAARACCGPYGLERSGPSRTHSCERGGSGESAATPFTGNCATDHRTSPRVAAGGGPGPS